ncbi:exodeoxyribonuclease VII small subunit [Caniella muris]|uniref:exodeoxyribonuclease VII small subunit n=1 Tax=Caniella muris TaxID=2941502 RepID=UPI003084651A
MGARSERAHRGFEEVTDRLDQIVSDVRAKDTSLERSLDLFDEAIALGSKAVELVDRTDFSPAEKERMAGLAAEDLVRAQEGAGGQVAAELLDGRASEGPAMAVPGHPGGENEAQAAVARAVDDADDGAWADGPKEG